jgi:outer membrane lipopolysaccharide assembly protein LptE/RlpB
MTHEYQSFKPFKALLLLSAVSMLGGCGGHPPIDKISAAEQALSQANLTEGDTYAPLEMRVAQDKLNQAKAAMNNEEYEKAAALADEASVNAELAAVKADSARTTNKLDGLKRSIDSLRHELGMKMQPGQQK